MIRYFCSSRHLHYNNDDIVDDNDVISTYNNDDIVDDNVDDNAMSL